MDLWQALKTQRLHLRAPVAADAGPMALYCQDVRVASMTTSIPHPYLPQMAENYIEQILAGKHRQEVWAMDASPDGGSSFIGVISHQAADNRIGYWVGPPFWSTGYASEAVQAVTEHLLNERGVPDVSASVFFDNPASQQVLRKAGFVETGNTWLYSIARDQEVPAVSFIRRAT